MVLDFARIEGLALGINTRSDGIRTLVHVGEQESGTDAGFGVKPGASVTVTASPDLEVEGAIHSILFCAEN